MPQLEHAGLDWTFKIANLGPEICSTFNYRYPERVLRNGDDKSIDYPQVISLTLSVLISGSVGIFV